VAAPHHVFLVPGFFGFDYLGDLAYFAHVQDVLAAWGKRARVAVRLHVVPTPPTASLRQRAARLLEHMAPALAAEPGPAHLVGHSSGGLDARLLVTPEVSLPGELAAEPLAAAVRTVVTLATPHYGTPLAAFFSSLLGQQLLEVFSLATSHALRTGRLPGEVLARLTAFFLRLGVSREKTPSPSVRKLHDRILADFDPERRGSLESFVELIARDQDLLPQITPAAIDVFNASTQDRPGVRYGSVVTQGRRASVRSFLSAGLSPYAHASHALYLCVGQLAGRLPAARAPVLTPAQRAALRRAYGAEPGLRTNDGIVPTLSQPWGEVIRAVWADHFDVIGHFHQPRHVPPHFDWLTSGSGFTRQEFVATWEAVAAFMFA
jgi:triacylglycerol esterase/lipase EstA (alpha/beta hydrolase family)